MKSRVSLLALACAIASIWSRTAIAQVAMETTFPAQVARFVFTPEQVKTFGPDGPVVIAGVPGHIIRIYEGFMLKHAGPAFTFANYGQFVQPQYDATPRIPAFTCVILGVLDQTDEASFYGHPANTQLVLADATNRALGKSIRMGVNGGVNTYGGDGANVELVLVYRILPATVALMSAAVPETPLP